MRPFATLTRRSFAVAALCFCAPRVVSAAPGETRPIAEALEVMAGSCLDRESLAQQLRAWLRRDDIDNRISIVVRNGATDRSFSVLRDGRPVVERVLPRVEVECEQLRAAVGLAIAIAIETMVVKTVDELKPPPAGRPELDLAPAPSKPETSPRRSSSLGLRFLGAIAVLPRPAVGASADLSVPLASLWDVNFSVLATSSAHVELGRGSGDLSLVAAQLDACVGSYDRLLGSRVCLGGVFGRLLAEGSGYATSYEPKLIWAAAAARLDGSVRVGRGLRIVLGVGGVVPVVVPRLEVRSPQGTIVASETLPKFGAMFSIGPQLEL
ncbi:MAG TPA: hypothetical protein VF881_15975 [Polyangiaceae bacterium]